MTLHKLKFRYGPLIYLRLGSVPAIVAANPDIEREFLMASELYFSTRKHSIAVDQLTYKSSYAFAHYGPNSKFVKRLSTSELELLKLTNNTNISQMMLSIRCSGNNNSQADEAKNLEIREFLDIIFDVLEDENSEVQLTRNNIKAIVLDFLTTTTDIIVARIEWALAELMNHPKVLEKARKQIDQVVGTNRIVQESNTTNLPYIQVVIKETLRLHPPIPVVSRKSVETCKIYGYDILENAIVFFNVWSIGRDPGYWKDPLKFKPERFLPSNNGSDHGASVVDIKGQHFRLLPFGSGRKGCLGMLLAVQKLHTTVAATIQCLDFNVMTPDGVKSAPGKEVVDMTERNGLTAPRAHDLVIIKSIFIKYNKPNQLTYPLITSS
ncbi:hypothetical protein PTKIN_Ptkin01aG0095100 [Pterospermum kingtungense]